MFATAVKFKIIRFYAGAKMRACWNHTYLAYCVEGCAAGCTIYFAPPLVLSLRSSKRIPKSFVPCCRPQDVTPRYLTSCVLLTAVLTWARTPVFRVFARGNACVRLINPCFCFLINNTRARASSPRVLFVAHGTRILSKHLVALGCLCQMLLRSFQQLPGPAWPGRGTLRRRDGAVFRRAD